jgi:uncharacterized protein (UPF0332 family)
MIDPSSFLDIANDMFSDDKYCHEIGYRTCVNRAYYAAHNISKQYLESTGCKFSSDLSVHKQVIEELYKKDSQARNLLY